MSRVSLWRSLLFAATLLCFLIPLSADAAQIDRLIVIDDVDATDFPSVAITFRAINAAGETEPLVDNDIEVYENGAVVDDFAIEAGERLPQYVIFVIDRGTSSVYTDDSRYGSAQMRAYVSRFADDAQFQDGYDTVAIFDRTNFSGDGDQTNTVLAPTTSLSSFESAVGRINWARSDSTTSSLDAIEDAIDRIESDTSGTDDVSAAVVFIAHHVHVPAQSVALQRAGAIGRSASAAGIRIYSIQANPNDDLTPPLEALAQESGGEYTRLVPGRDNASTVSRFYSEVLGRTDTYRVTYRSTSGESGTREVRLAPAGGGVNAIDAVAASFEIEVPDPAIRIVAPSDNASFTRTWEQSGYDRNSIAVEVEIDNETGGILREIEKIDVLVDNQPMGQPFRPESAATTAQLAVSLDNIEANRNFLLQVRVTDEFGRTGESGTINVQINVIPPTPEPTQPPPVTNGGSTTQTPIIVRPVNPCDEARFSFACISQWLLDIFPWVGMVVLGGGMFVLFRRRDQVATSVKRAATEVRKTILGGGGPRKRVYARLEILSARSDLVGEYIDIVAQTTTLGRNPKLADVVLYDENSRSTVSGEHATIQYDKGTFYLTDNNSANGTSVNGKYLEPNTPHILKVGDVVVLGDVVRQGARMRFELPAEQAEQPITPEDLISGDSDVTELVDTEIVASPSVDTRTEIFDASQSETILDFDDEEEGFDLEPDDDELADDGWMDDLS